MGVERIMPVYTYRCDKCGDIDITHSMSEKIDYCPECNSGVKRKFSISGVAFYGPGFYSKDKYRVDKFH